MNIKFKATIIILALMLLTSLILAKREEINENKSIPTIDSAAQVVSVQKAAEVSKQNASRRYIHQLVKPNAQEIELSSTGLNANLPLPELMQQVGFKINTESTIDYTETYVVD